MENVKTSMYNNNRSYVYNKAFARLYDNNDLFDEAPMNTDIRCERPKCNKKPLKMFENIRDWAQTRGLYDEGNSHTQYVKLQEEAGELAKALLDNDKMEVMDAIGDMVVVLTNLAHLQETTIESCIAQAYNEIKNRKGSMINGTFVKDE